MKQFEDIQKKMPYAESEDYLDRLVQKATEEAIRKGKQPATKMRSIYTVVATAAAVLLLFTVGITQFRSHDDQIATIQQETSTLIADNSSVSTEEPGPIDEFLNNLSDEEAQLLAYYEMEDIPEYE